MADEYIEQDREKRVKRLKEIFSQESRQAAAEARKDRVQKYKESIVKANEGISISGDGNVIGDGNITGNVINIHPKEKKPVRPKIVVKTGDGVVTSEQKSEMLSLVKEIVELSQTLKKKPYTYQSVWSSLNGNMKVNSYHEIPYDKFNNAKAFLQKQLALLNGMPSAKKKSSNWRNARYRGLNARCREFENGREKMLTYMMKNFGKDSQSALTDEELEQLYRYVFGWK